MYFRKNTDLGEIDFMRKEATLKEWEKLYETETRIKERKPWQRWRVLWCICLRRL